MWGWELNVNDFATEISVLFQYKDCLSRYRDSHYKDKAFMRLSYLYDGSSYTGKASSLYCDGPHIILGDFSGKLG